MNILARKKPADTNAAGLTVRLVTTSIGAEITGIDLTQPFGPEVAAALRQALLDHEVIFFRDQHIDTDQHLALARVFGEPAYSKKLPMYDGIENVSLLENDGSRHAVGAAWHTDNTDFTNPPLGSVLYAEEVPEIGGDTMWASMTAAYEALSPGMQAHLRTLSAVHDNSRVAQAYAGSSTLRTEGTTVDQPVIHPVIRAHPESGRLAIFVNGGYTMRIVGIPEVESRHLLAMLAEHITRPEFQVRFRWEKGSLAIWDNRSTQHYALDDYDQLRRMRRVQIVGDEPRPAPSPNA